MKCRVCRGPAVIDIRRHNSNFCVEHFLRLCRDQVEKAIKRFAMLAPGDRVLVAVSGGKDSLALWDLLVALGYEADGLYVGLGIDGYSDVSGEFVHRFVEERGLNLVEVDLRADEGFDVPTAAAVTKRVPCSACGLSKRHLFDRAAREGGYDAVATGHNLDDEAAVLFGNLLKWQTDYLGRQRPMLPARDGFPKKVKPLVRLTERETAAYCVLRGIDYQVEECPMAAGNKHLGFKETLNDLELRSPGAKHDLYFGFLDRAVDRFETATDEGSEVTLVLCAECGAPTTGEVCAYCRLAARARAARADGGGSRAGKQRAPHAEPVPLGPTRRRR